jgi:hypothetical protein
MRRIFACLLFSIALLGTCITAPIAHAEGKGAGGCIITPKAPIYHKAKGEEVLGAGELGDCVVGITTRGIMGHEFSFEEEDGRVHVAYFPTKEEKGLYHTAWMNPADLARFSYECGCGSNKRQRAECTPFSGIVSYVYNTCYKEARDRKRGEILKQGAAASGSAAAASEGGASAKGSEKALRNDDVLSLVKVGLDDKLIISKIQGAEATTFDLSTDGIVALKTANVSNAVIDAMMKKAGK